MLLNWKFQVKYRRFLKYNLPKFPHEEIENTSSPICIKETKFDIKTLLTEKTAASNVFTKI